jgi:hypothetical protein
MFNKNGKLLNSCFASLENKELKQSLRSSAATVHICSKVLAGWTFFPPIHFSVQVQLFLC